METLIISLTWEILFGLIIFGGIFGVIAGILRKRKNGGAGYGIIFDVLIGIIGIIIGYIIGNAIVLLIFKSLGNDAQYNTLFTYLFMSLAAVLITLFVLKSTDLT
jgi:uncharacterized membrane protein YeaQ/YmgE (transglycosylase-associated protein family)